MRVALKRDGLADSWGAARFGDCQAVRHGLEPLVCREAAVHHPDEDIRALRNILAAMDRHADDARAYMEVHWALHRRIAKLCRNAPLHSIHLTLLDFLEDGLDPGGLQALDIRADLEAHRELVAAIDEGPGPRLKAAIERHEQIAALVPDTRRGRTSRPG